MPLTLHLFALLVCFFMLPVAWVCYLYRSHHSPSHSNERLRSLVHCRLKPRSPLACPLCCRSSARLSSQKLPPLAVRPWREIKSRRGAPKRVTTEGFACPNGACQYDGITDAQVLASSGRWQPWANRADPDLSRPCLSDDLQCAHPHAVVPPENTLVSGSPGAECSSRRAGSVCGRACLWHRACHHHEPFSCGQESTRSTCTNALSASWWSRTCNWMSSAPGYAAPHRCCGSGWPVIR
jgi:hypothetical protein